MGLLNVAIPILAAFCVSLQGAYADCTIQFTFPNPQVMINFGTKNLLKQAESVTRGISETVDMYCASGFRISRNSYNYISPTDYPTNKLKLKCFSNGFAIVTNSGNKDSITRAQCLDPQVSQLYQSLTHMPDCNSYVSLVIGQDFGDIGSLKYLAVCYDIIKQRLIYGSYTAYPTNAKVIEKTHDGQLNQLGFDIKVNNFENIFNTFGSTDIRDALRKNLQLSEDTFEYASLIQDSALANEISGFNQMLNVVWLHGLRTGNWRHFLNALHSASVNAKFDVRIGTSGTVTLPVNSKCNETRPLTLELNTEGSRNAPAYIWAHIKALQPVANSIDEFVVMAHNSPFVTTYEAEQLCANVCQEVAWLKDTLFIKLRQYAAYGLVQCCRLSDVAHKLDNFPTEIIEFPNSNKTMLLETPEMRSPVVDPVDEPLYADEKDPAAYSEY